MSGLLLLRPGPLSLLQDGGRYGWQRFGVSPSGVLDGHAAAWANRLLGNPWQAPLVEIALGGVELECRIDGRLALTGADAPAHLDGRPVPGWSSFSVRRGQRLEVGFVNSGQRLYLAAAGGLRGCRVLGSLACQNREGLGGLDGHGTPLRAGDLLPCVSTAPGRCASVPWRFRPDYRASPKLRVILGGDVAAFGPGQVEAFFAAPWRLDTASDRMGARLAGATLAAPRREWSRGVVDGTIQVPPDGRPIILLRDRQTIGGYPILGWLHPLDQMRLAQCPAHQRVHFQPCELTEAQENLRAFRHFFQNQAQG